MIIVAGGTGFIGRAVTAALAQRGHDVAVLSHSLPDSTIFIGGEGGGEGGKDVPVRHADVTQPDSLAAALAGADTAINAVQFAGYPNENPRTGLTFDAVDRKGTEALVAAAKQQGVARFIYLSGAGAAPDAEYHWFRAKWAAESAVRGSGLRYAILRPSWVYGAGDPSLSKYVAFVRSPLPIVPVVGDGKQQLQPVFVHDVAAAVAGIIDAGPRDEVYEIGGPDVVTMDQVIRTVEEVTGKRKPLIHQPTALVRLLMSPKALLPWLPLPLTPEGVEFAVMDAVADNTALLRDLPDLRLTPLREGLASYLGRSQRQPVAA